MIDPAFAAILGIFDVVYPIERTDVERPVAYWARGPNFQPEMHCMWP